MKRTAIKRRTRLRPVGLGRNWKKALDHLCRQATFARDRHACVRCGKESNIQWSHVRSRRYLSTRWAMFNVKTLCGGCHLWWGQNPLMAAEWFQRKYPDRHQWVVLASHSIHGTIDKEATRLELQAEIRKYEGGA